LVGGSEPQPKLPRAALRTRIVRRANDPRVRAEPREMLVPFLGALMVHPSSVSVDGHIGADDLVAVGAAFGGH
jgi:hypothetical protein